MKDKLITFAGKVGAQRHLSAIRDSFAMIMPILIAGSLVTLANVLLKLEPVQSIEFLKPLNNFLISINGNVWWGTFDMMALFIVVILGYNLAKSYDVNPPVASIIALSSYLTIVPQTPDGGTWGSISRSYTNATALFVGMIITVISVEIFVKLSSKDKLVIKMPEGVPPAVSKSFAALIPGVIAIMATAILVLGFEMAFASIMSVEHMSIFAIITKWVSTPLSKLADTLPAALSITFLSHFLWIFGIHGVNALEGIIQPALMPLLQANIDAFAQGAQIPHIVTKQMFDTYVYMGGCGTTLGLLIAIFISSKNEAKRSVAKLSIAPGIFNINEPVMFGIPIVLNPILAIPFLITPLVLTTITYFALWAGLAGRIIAVAPWFTPPILSAVITTNMPLESAILQVINLVISVLIYMPFVLMSDKQEEIAMKEKI